ncbi:MAG: hypothetical protein HYW06_00070 [Gemmatimonadetes bacterium]|nr:hypothetical protein [Gemmatimonadota bacterium]MBI2402954.1 hypothetical protein [Gemmatimonadota bacterium]MBI2535389.1 hypothetical protein [Gemmatimonadota bacterium]MBI2615483.1 hypothetical protein [Gemmatimonadota bacterium]MBI3082466.1 hypothetical protein [Gemmatimonadota bacterium]
MSPRPRARILANLETVYREAYNRAKEAGDAARMLDLDAAYQREQLLLEVLLDIRDALRAPGESGGIKSAVDKLAAVHKLTKLKG